MEKDMPFTPAMLCALATGEVDLSAATPGGIEASEKMGQIDFIRSSAMPADMGKQRAEFEALGFTFGAAVDDIFLEATLPPGWTKEATSHDYYSDIVDEKGVKRADVFYKAAFYDRRARARLVRDEEEE